ncbi:DUF4097 family beta strand repeat-containing protein [Salinimicrobium sediminilitoris]|uniref:hypothetical protein n=1 Tax=Salinimicrobium sediminilitoris TaxID=2876715 RepID=UPI001E340FE5|nr:hypothetical protein [Salinimicrobium sediminilitoris]MCC8359366.1 hypothetical protein [Salinimicrobium sediminilitoris]
MKFYLFSFFLLFFFSVSAQKVTREVISADNIEKISLSGDEIFKVSFSTASDKEIVITTQTEGEYFNDISLDAELRDKTLFLTSRYREILQNGYDKLSAHKVFSMEVELEIPKNMIIEVNSNVASVYLTGIYEQVFVQLKNGSCYLEDFSGDAVINTYDGNILGTARSINAEAKSRNGEVEIPKILHGNHKMVLTSINGDIKISETK